MQRPGEDLSSAQVRKGDSIRSLLTQHVKGRHRKSRRKNHKRVGKRLKGRWDQRRAKSNSESPERGIAADAPQTAFAAKLAVEVMSVSNAESEGLKCALSNKIEQIAPKGETRKREKNRQSVSCNARPSGGIGQ